MMTLYDAIIMRTIIDLPDDQVAALAELCEREKISRAEAVRRAVDGLLARHRVGSREEAFGAWAPHEDSRKLVESLRGEWAR
jgi:metal-responsive CopG/Arc/MetJ family transcriptional regulator